MAKAPKQKVALSPWEKIVRADKRSTGLRLSAAEVGRLACDDAIQTRAALDAGRYIDPLYEKDK